MIMFQRQIFFLESFFDVVTDILLIVSDIDSVEEYAERKRLKFETSSAITHSQEESGLMLLL